MPDDKKPGRKALYLGVLSVTAAMTVTSPPMPEMEAAGGLEARILAVRQEVAKRQVMNPAPDPMAEQPKPFDLAQFFDFPNFPNFPNFPMSVVK